MTVLHSARLRTGALVLGVSLALTGPLRAGSLQVQSDLVASNLSANSLTLGGETISNWPPAAVVALASVVLTNDTLSVSFGSIPQSYQSLELVFCTRTTRSAPVESICWQANGDTNANYRVNLILFSTATVYNTVENDVQGLCGVAQSTNVAGTAWAVGRVQWVNYSSTTQWKSAVGLSTTPYDGNGGSTNTVWLAGSTWKSTPAISSLLIKTRWDQYFCSGTTFTLYGGK